MLGHHNFLNKDLQAESIVDSNHMRKMRECLLTVLVDEFMTLKELYSTYSMFVQSLMEHFKGFVDSRSFELDIKFNVDMLFKFISACKVCRDITKPLVIN